MSQNFLPEFQILKQISNHQSLEHSNNIFRLRNILRFIMITKQIMFDIRRRNLQTLSNEKEYNFRVREVLQEVTRTLKQDVEAHYNKSLLCWKQINKRNQKIFGRTGPGWKLWIPYWEDTYRFPWFIEERPGTLLER